MLAAALLLGVAPAPAPAHTLARPSISIAPDEKAASERFFEAMNPLPLPDRLKVLEEVLGTLIQPTPFRAVVVCTRAKTLGAMDDPGFKASAADCYRLLPQAPMAMWMYAESRKFDADPQPAARAFIAAIRAEPGISSFLTPDLFQQLLDRLDSMGNTDLSGRLLDALTNAGYGAANPRWTSWASRRALDNAVALGDLAKAERMLPTILNPEDLLPLLIDRRYQSIRARIDDYAKHELVPQRDAYVSATGGQFEVSRTIEARRDYASAMEAAGRAEDAVNLLRAGLLDKERWDRRGYDAVLMGVRAAAMLGDLGRADEGTALLAKLDADLIATPFSNAADNIIPNEVILLNRAKRYREALDLLARRAPDQSRFANAADFAFVPGLKACALFGLGQAEAAGKERDKAFTIAPDNVTIRRMVIGCMNDGAAAKVEILHDLQLPARMQALLVSLRRAEVSKSPDPLTGWTALLRDMTKDAEVRAQMDRLSTPVPPTGIDAFQSWRGAGRASTNGTQNH